MAKIKIYRLKPGEHVTAPGDLMKIRGNEHLVPITTLIGFRVSDVERFCGDDLEGIYRKKEEVQLEPSNSDRKLRQRS
jgi:hypothetical protein